MGTDHREKGDKYYFYYWEKIQTGTSAIGVAWADNPAGPYTDLGTPLWTVSYVQKCRRIHGTGN